MSDTLTMDRTPAIHDIFPIREDRVHRRITDENCQGYFSPDACLFIGK